MPTCALGLLTLGVVEIQNLLAHGPCVGALVVHVAHLAPCLSLYLFEAIGHGLLNQFVVAAVFRLLDRHVDGACGFLGRRGAGTACADAAGVAFLFAGSVDMVWLGSEVD